MSSRKGKRLQPSANHLKSSGELLVMRATPYSFWFDSWWYEDDPKGGAKGVAVNWFKDFTSSELKDPKCQALINYTRRLVYAMRHSRSIKRRSIRSVYAGKAQKLLSLARWMYHNTVWTFSEFTPEIADWYKSDLLEQGPSKTFDSEDLELPVDGEGAKANTDEITVAALRTSLRVIVDVFELAHEFEAFPELCVPEHPFRGQSSSSVSEGLAIGSDGWIPRVPDEGKREFLRTF